MNGNECQAEFLIDYDSVDCRLQDGHAGPHRTTVVDGDLWWARDIIRRRDS